MSLSRRRIRAIARKEVRSYRRTTSLVAAGADILAIAPSQHSLEDVYLELVDSDPEAER